MSDPVNMETAADEDMEFVEGDSSDSEADEKVYLPGMPIDEGEKLAMDETAYVMFHEAQTGSPCMSFDVIQDPLGDRRDTFPLTAYCVAGSQAEQSHNNKIVVLKMSNLHKLKAAKESDSEDEDEDEDEEEEDEAKKPVFQAAMIKHNGGVNRIRSTKLSDTTLAASWSETGKVYIWDLSAPLAAVDNNTKFDPKSAKPLHTFSGHASEGFAMDWCAQTPGRLATGDCSNNIHVWNPQPGGWSIDPMPYSSHTASVEDIQWSPNEANVFASCSVDKSIRVWDARCRKTCQLTVENTHSRDVNVISWNRRDPFIVSGGDDGLLKIWDLRQFQSGKAVVSFAHHKSPITTVEWNPNDDTVFAAASEDDQLTVWDLGMERDTTEGEVKDVPSQLLFIHQGQQEMKELHFHPQLPGVIFSTAQSGFNVFKTINT